jgi:large subunit ribosomal protein L21
MYAIVEIAGQQFKVSKDSKVYVNRLEGKEGDSVSFERVLLVDDSGNITLGAPAIDGASVEAKVLQHLKGDKVIVFKKKRRKGFKKKNGHRQALTQIQISGISLNGAKKSAAKTEKAAPAKQAVMSDADTVNFAEDHELNYHLKKNGLSQTKDNRALMVTLGDEAKAKLGKNVLTHEEVDAFITENISKFESKK